MKNKDTICAIATPPGHGGIGIVRISGDDAKEVFSKIWKGKQPASKFEPHRMYYGKIITPQNLTAEIAETAEEKNNGINKLSATSAPSAVKKDFEGVIDSVFSVWMAAPRTYTGEDVVEISCHGGSVIMQRIIDSCLKAGARMAEPGEFTKRAFLNGKMDLIQAEAVADLIAATSESASRSAREQLEGRLSKHINELVDELVSIRAYVEASIDFPDGDIDFLEKEKIEEKLRAVSDKMRSLADTYREGRIIKDGVNVAIIGKPNVGKSSLFNAVVGRERAIVHHESGTTRDLVAETIQIGGIAFHVTDAAGVHEGDNEVEKIGIEKARDVIDLADFILFVIDGSKPLDARDQDVYRILRPERTIVCINKSDLFPSNEGTKHASRHLENVSGEGVDGFVKVSTSALLGEGIEMLKEILAQNASGRKKSWISHMESVMVTSIRHKEALDLAALELKRAITQTKKKNSAEFIAHHLSQAHESLGRITGIITTDAILDEIFSRFCIGK